MTICAGCVIIFYEVIRLKTAVLFGAGQAGAAVLRLLYGYEPLCFADNDEKKRGGEFCSLPVLSAAEALALGPDCVFICVTDAARAAQMRAQLGGNGFIALPGGNHDMVPRLSDGKDEAVAKAAYAFLSKSR